MQQDQDALVRDQVTRLLGVLRRLAQAKNPPVRHTSGYDRTLWLDEVVAHCPMQDPGGPGHELLRVARVAGQPEPPAPRALRGWVQRTPRVPSDTDVIAEPALHDRGPLHGQQVYLVDAPTVRDAFDAWMAAWRPWAHAERIRRPRSRMYDALVELARTVADRPGSELVLASGLLQAPDPSLDGGLRVHLLTQLVRIDLDADTDEMVCTLAGDGVRLEDEDVLGAPLFQGSAGLRDRLAEQVASPIAPGAVTFLGEWAARALTVPCPVVDNWAQGPEGGPDVRLTTAPALVARRRGASALHRYHDAMERDLRDTTRPVPAGLAQLVRAVAPAERLAALGRAGATAPAVLADDPLFPLPATEEQAGVLARLAHDTGVVVEGPPGTGKTHTIANIVGALLARGQRVLVTSEKAHALSVLRDRLPPGLRDLCVSPGDEAERPNGHLERSVLALAGRRAEFDPGRGDRRIADLAARRADASRRHAELFARVRTLREAEIQVHPEIAAGYRGTLAQIARALVRTAGKDDWVTGPARGRPPVSQADLVELLSLLAQDTPRRRSRRSQDLTDAPLPVEVFRGHVEAIDRAPAPRVGGDGELLAVLGDLPPDAVGRLGPLCAEVAEAIAALRTLPGLASWALSVADQQLDGRETHLWQRAVDQLEGLDGALEHDELAGPFRVEVTPPIDVAVAAGILEEFVDRLGAGGSRRRMFKSAEQRAAEGLGDSVLVDGSPPLDRFGAEVAAHHLRVLEAASWIDDAFVPLGAGLPLDAARPRLIEAMLGLRTACRAVGRLGAAASALGRLLTALAPQQRPALRRVSDLERVAVLGMSVGPARAVRLAQSEIDDAAASLAALPDAHRAPEQTALLAALRDLDPGAYGHAVLALGLARREQREQRRADELTERLRVASPALAAQVVAGGPEWTARLPRWPQAWARACAVTWMSQRQEPGAERALDAELSAAVAELERLTAELAVEQAWRACLHRMDAAQVQASQAYATNRAGAQTTPHVSGLRDALAVARSAVPAWVLPIQQVLDIVPPRPDSFDVVIVDEATHADLTSAFLLWLAPRVIVVGDDGQCVPLHSDPAPADRPADRVDAGPPDVAGCLQASFAPDRSMFSLLRGRFGQVVRLREHFRCMPEIIAWSSETFYRDAPSVPLRRFGTDRLAPLRSTFVPVGRVEPLHGDVVNRAEAAAIAEAVAACAADPAYVDATFGVVVLQGRPQVDLIIDELRGRLDADEWKRRRLRVGLPPDFQGDERDVVWLSMVAAPNAARRPLTGPEIARRYNVAASRARDQLWLFHSITPELLAPADIRRSLLEHVLAGAGAAPGPVLTDVRPDRRHDAFGSLFEQRLHLDLVARGYHVTPQVQRNRRRIDLVVTGADGTVAVECDGEEFHTTSEQRTADLRREQELKRCGWVFERVRESTYILDRDAALAPLWAALDRLGIEPLGDVVDGIWTPRPERTALLPAVAVPAPRPAGRRAGVGPVVTGDTDELRVASMPALASGRPVGRVSASGGRPRPEAGSTTRTSMIASVAPSVAPPVVAPTVAPPSPSPSPRSESMSEPTCAIAAPSRPVAATPPSATPPSPYPPSATPPSPTPASPTRSSVEPVTPLALPAVAGPADPVDVPADPADVPTGAVEIQAERPEADLPAVASVGRREASFEAARPVRVPGQRVSAEPARPRNGSTGAPGRHALLEGSDIDGERASAPDPEAVPQSPTVAAEVAPTPGPRPVPPRLGAPVVRTEPVGKPAGDAAQEPGEPSVSERVAAPATRGSVAEDPPAASLDRSEPEPSVPDPALDSVPPPPSGSLFDALPILASPKVRPPAAVLAEDRALLLNSAATGPLTTTWVMRALAVTEAEAEAFLQAMVDDGLLRRSSRSTDGGYVLPDADPVAPEPAVAEPAAAEPEPAAAESGRVEAAPVETAPVGADPAETPAVGPVTAEPEPVEPVEADVAPVDPTRCRTLLDVAAHRPLTTAAVRNLLGVTPDEATELLVALVESGLLDRRGEGRRVHFVLRDPAAAEAETRETATRETETREAETRETDPTRADPTGLAAVLSAAADTAAAGSEPTQIAGAVSGVAVSDDAEGDLAAEFHREMTGLHERARAETGLHDSRFPRLLAEHGGVGAARELLTGGPVSSGFTTLWMRRRLDLTVEALVLQRRFAPLFEESERESARGRLASYGFESAS